MSETPNTTPDLTQKALEANQSVLNDFNGQIAAWDPNEPDPMKVPAVNLVLQLSEDDMGIRLDASERKALYGELGAHYVGSAPHTDGGGHDEVYEATPSAEGAGKVFYISEEYEKRGDKNVFRNASLRGRPPVSYLGQQAKQAIEAKRSPVTPISIPANIGADGLKVAHKLRQRNEDLERIEQEQRTQRVRELRTGRA